MAELKSGLFTVPEFSNARNTLRLAPDAFIVINGSLGQKVLTPANVNSKSIIDVRGGVTSLSIASAVFPPGANRASIEVVAPEYKGLHEDYYVTLPNGTRIPYFIPMMEVQIFMKGRYTESAYGYKPQYYPVFWGLITSVSQNYSGGAHTFSISCEDLLVWWKYQKITLVPTANTALFGSPTANRFPTVFKNMSAWEIIYALFIDNFFIQKGVNGQDAAFNFVYPQLSNISDLPTIGKAAARESFGGLARNIIKYWDNRFGFGMNNIYDVNNNTGNSSGDRVGNRAALEMFGLVGPVKLESMRDSVMKFMSSTYKQEETQTSYRADLDLNYNLFARVQPFGSFDLYGSGSEPLVNSKLEIAQKVCEEVYMEFFLDTNGHFVFKPPFYNLDVVRGNIPYYQINPEEIINFNFSFDSNNICNYLRVTGPMYHGPDNLEAVGYHIDAESIKQFGIRYEELSVRYGYNAEQLQAVAIAEMTRRNGLAYSGSVSIPLRPELRLGYPVYLKHIDTFYYVTGINHSITFGQSATTDLSIQYRRDRVFDDGTSGIGVAGDVLKGCVLKLEKSLLQAADRVGSSGGIDQKSRTVDNLNNIQGLNSSEVEELQNDILKEDFQRRNDILAGPDTSSLYTIRKARLTTSCSNIKLPNTKNAISSNELVMITDETVPFTDRYGYRHIGGFPYGANLSLVSSGKLIDQTDPTQVIDNGVSTQVNASGIKDGAGPELSSNESLGNNSITSTEGCAHKTDEVVQEESNKKMEKRIDTLRQLKEVINPETRPELYQSIKGLITGEGMWRAEQNSTSVRVQIDAGSENEKTTNQTESDYQLTAKRIFEGQ